MHISLRCFCKLYSTPNVFQNYIFVSESSCVLCLCYWRHQKMIIIKFNISLFIYSFLQLLQPFNIIKKKKKYTFVSSSLFHLFLFFFFLFFYSSRSALRTLLCVVCLVIVVGVILLLLPTTTTPTATAEAKPELCPICVIHQPKPMFQLQSKASSLLKSH